MHPVPRIAFYGDDFTGSTDTLMALATAGLSTLLFVEPPDATALARAGPLDAVGLAGHARSLAPPQMDDVLPHAFGALLATGARVLHYKVCSTFDSAPDIGSIGHAIGIGRRFVSNAFVPIVAGQPNLGRYCAFANLFALDRQGGSMFRIDRHPTMSRHPVTPMGEADLRAHLVRQGLPRVASFDIAMLERDEREHQARLAALLADQPDAVLFDLTSERHLAAIGRLIWQQAKQAPLLAVGPTGAAQALMAHWRTTGELGREQPVAAEARPVDRTFIVSGSLSPVTAAQIEAARSNGFVVIPLDPRALAASPQRGSAAVGSAVAKVVAALQTGASVIACSSADVVSLQTSGPRVGDQLARACGAVLADVLERVALSRVGMAGGDTSSLGVRALGLSALSYAFSIGSGCGVCRVHAPGSPVDGLEILLKGGQMGALDVFANLRAGRQAT